MPKEKVLPTEKAILRDKLDRCEELVTYVEQFKPLKFRNPVPEHQIGRYRLPDRRICVTAEMELIKSFIEKKKDLPSFLEAGPRDKLHFDPAEVRIGIVTPGGIAPGLNTVIHSIVHMHSDVYRMKEKAYGFLNGFQGLAEDRSIYLDPSVTIQWIHKGGSGLGCGRGKQDIALLADRLEDRGVNILYVIGGDGSLTGAHEIAGELQKRNKRIVVAGIPKTIDNDILWVWQSFGFSTAVEEATRIVNAIHDEAKAAQRICLLHLFGRDAGFIAGHAALASGQVDVVLVPEVEFKIEPTLRRVERIVAKKGYALVVLAEGACPKDYGEDRVREEIQRQGLNPDDRTHPKVSKAFRELRLNVLQTKFEEHFRAFKSGRHGVFVMEPRHLIRAIPPGSVDQIYCQRLADMAVHNALAGFTDFMISQWLTEYVLVPLDLVADRNKRIPPSGIFWTTVISATGQPSFES